ncbi:MAG: hypothetical protein M5T52_24215 [Ignavibacteriaceae bacterium]|nr:hypothetical protein [Ignavibacteriaceae bacterium]
MLFGYPGYSGIFNPEWYRRLISFYIKIQKYSDEKFSNPLRYAKDLKVHEIPVYLFYLMHINNELPSVFSSLMITKKNISDSISTIKAFISKAYGVRDLAQVRQRIEHLERDISEVDQNIKKLFLLRNYDKSEAEADALTAEIKNLYYENASAKRIIEEYDNSLASNEGFSPSNVERIYNAVSNELGSTVKKSLEDAISFRRSLSSSRKQFIKATLEELRQSILKREKLIEEKEEKRRLLLNNLYATTAYSDLASAYQSKSGFQSQKDELISQTRLLNDLNSELQNLKS